MQVCMYVLPFSQNDRPTKGYLSYLPNGAVLMPTDRCFLPHQPVPGRHSNAVLGDEEARNVADAGGAKALPDVEHQHAGEQLGAGRMLRRTH